MSTTHGQPGLSSDQRSTIRSAILSTRHTLEDELRRQLEKYGIYENKRLPLEDLSHLSAEERHTRRTLDAAIERELESTEGDLERSITNYVREATKTYLNRFVALKTIEVRGLVEETIIERPEYGNRSYMHHTVAEIAGELTNAPDDGFSAALDLAYQEIGAEIRMIFEESEHTAIDLDAQVREEVLNELDAIDDEAWESDEALGWVYQYFGKEEREDIDQRVDDENYKIGGTDIATKTQLFTPRYIVEWMVDNSLGRTWLEMKGERTSIDDEDNCFYLTPSKGSLSHREKKPVEDITVLDPACGSGHMLLYAFDVLYQMYLEEGEVPEKYIPREILRNNLYGIDIDSGAAQIAALSLYLKAKEKSSNAEIPQINIVSADAVLINGNRKKEILSRSQTELEKEILEEIWESFGNIRELGSLVQVEEKIDTLLKEYRDEFGAAGQAQFTTDGDITTQSTFVTEGEEKTWEGIKKRLLWRVQELVDDALAHDDPIEEMFANEVGKTVHLLDVLLDDYDTVVSNPPYLQSSKMGAEIKEYVRSNFTGKRDLYGAFIERCRSFSEDTGYYSLITPQSYMYTYSYRKLREKLLESVSLIEAVHSTSLSVGSEETVMAVYQPGKTSNNRESRFIRAVGETNKQNYLYEAISSLRNSKSPHGEYLVKQDTFLEIGRQPFLYWFGNEILDLFSEYPSIGEVAEVKQGLATGDDGHFVRKYWEVPQSEIDNRYRRFQKSGTNSEYYDLPQDYVDWQLGGDPIKDSDGSYPRNEDYYFDEGITFRSFGNYFVSRIKDEDTIFSHKAHAVFSERLPTEILLANLNSTLHRFIANGLNPGLNFEVGDAKRFPVKTDYQNRSEIVELVSTGIRNRTELSSLTEESADFDGSMLADLIESGPADIRYNEEVREARILTIHGLIDQLIFEEYDISPGAQKELYANLPKNVSSLNVDSDIHVPYPDYLNEQLNLCRMEESQLDSAVDELGAMRGEPLREVAIETGLSPLTVAQLRYDHDLYTNDEVESSAGRVVSLIIGSLFGRWETGYNLPTLDDEILAFDNPDATVHVLLRDSLEKLFEGSDMVNQELETALGEPVVDWLRNRFFRYHHVDEYKPRGERSPIYWQLESPNGAFSCYIYYHEIDGNTLPKLRGQYIDSRLERLENELASLKAQTSGENPDKDLLKRIENIREDIDDISEFRDTIDEMIDDGVAVDVEKGIWENIKEWDQYEVLETGLPKLKSSYSR